MTDPSDTGDIPENEVRHEGSAFEPVPRDAEATTKPYPPEADPQQAGDVEAAEVPGEQTDPDRRLTGGDLPVSDADTTPSTHVTPGSTEPPD